MSKLCQHIWNDKTYPADLHEVGLLFTHLILLPGSLRGQDPVHREEYMVGRISDCFESLIGAMEVSGHHDEACGLMGRVLFADIDDIMRLTDGLDIRSWDDVLNSRAGRRLREFRESMDV